MNNAATVAPVGPSTGLAPAGVLDAFRLNVLAPLAWVGRLLPGQAERGRGPVVNVSSGIVAHPAGMIGGSTYAATKAALEAQTLSLAAEYAGTGVTIYIHRPGGVDTAMQEWIRNQDSDEIGHLLHDGFAASWGIRGLADSGAFRPRPGRPREGLRKRGNLGRHRPAVT